MQDSLHVHNYVLTGIALLGDNGKLSLNIDFLKVFRDTQCPSEILKFCLLNFHILPNVIIYTTKLEKKYSIEHMISQ